MSEQHPYRAAIAAVPDGTRRPKWSVMIPTYNCARYLRETLASVLAQALDPDLMQIEVVDDCSTSDDPAAVVEELGLGRVGFYRQVRNVGYIRNFETCLERSQGKLIHLLHGDDYVRDGFYYKMQRAFDENPEVGAAFCRHIYMDEHGHWKIISGLERPESGVISNWLERIAVKQRIQTPSIVVRRDVYERLGAFDRRLTCWGEDWEMWVRIAAQYPVWHEVEPLAVYRTNRLGSLSRNSMRTGQNMQDMRKAIEICQSYLPKTVASNMYNKAKENWAWGAVGTARQMLDTGDTDAAMAQIREALLCSRSFRVIKAVIGLLIDASAGQLRRKYS